MSAALQRLHSVDALQDFTAALADPVTRYPIQEFGRSKVEIDDAHIVTHNECGCRQCVEHLDVERIEVGNEARSST